jgi:hypothetical protein
MDLYSQSAATASGNARYEANRIAKESVQNHNDTIANTISGIRSGQKTAATLQQAKDAVATSWSGAGMPDKIKNYKAWRDGTSKGANPTDAAVAETQATPPPSDAATSAQTPEQTVSDPPTARAEGSPSGAGQVEEQIANTGVEDTGTAGSRLFKGFKTLGGNLSDETAERIGKATGVLGAAAVGGMDIYEDMKGGPHLAGDNWEEKTSNATQIVGAVADIVGTVFPPAALLGGVLDVGAGILGEVGSVLDEKKQQSADTATQAAETVSSVGTAQSGGAVVATSTS